MQTYMRRTLASALFGLGILAMPGCDRFTEVDNPNNLETESINPERDASLLSNSVFTRYLTSNLEYAYILGAWFTNHARVGDTFPTRNTVGQRNIPDAGNETDAVWASIHTNIQFARTTIASIAPAGNTIELARAYWVSGFSMLNMADYFCEGTIAASTTLTRPKMTVAAIYDSAIVELTQARTVIAAIAGTPTTEATNLDRAAQVGIARALLQLGRNAAAATAAAAVPAGFSYSLTHIDNTSQRALGNQVWSFSESRISLVTGPEFRTIASGVTQDAAGQKGQTTITGSGVPDPRVKYDSTTRLAQDGVLGFYRQAKMPGWASAMRFASKLEAQYIEEEARQNPATMFAFVNLRRAAGNQAPIAATTNMTTLMSELMLQKSIDFWLEGHEMRDFRRNPTIYPFVLPTGNNYYKTSLGPVGTETCWPVPRSERERNPNWDK
jgi:hypothetical protein